MPKTNLSIPIGLNAVKVVKAWAEKTFLKKDEAADMLGSRIKFTFDSDFVGQTCTVTGGGMIEKFNVPDTMIAYVNVKEQDTTYTANCNSNVGDPYEWEVYVGNYYGIYPVAFSAWKAFIEIKCDPNATVKVVGTATEREYRGMANESGEVTIAVSASDTYSVTATLGEDTTKPVEVKVEESGKTYPCKLPSLILQIVSWADGTDDEVAAMIDAARAGTIDLQESGWNVGDVRTIQVKAFSAASGTVSVEAQEVEIVLTSFDEYNGCGNKAQFDFKDCLTKGVRMNSSNTNAGGYGDSEMKTNTLPALVNALPDWLKDRLITFDVKASAGSQSNDIVTVSNNKLALRSEIEMFGTTQYSKPGEGDGQISYYSDVNHRIKHLGKSGSTTNWWERSPLGSGSKTFCTVNSNGSANTTNASNAYGVSPFGCI